MKLRPTGNTLRLPLLLAILVSLATLSACASSGSQAHRQGPYESEEANAEFNRIVREQYLHELRQYEYNYVPGVEIEYEFFNNSFRRNPTRTLSFDDFYQRQFELAQTEDPLKLREEKQIEQNEEVKKEREVEKEIKDAEKNYDNY